MIAIDEAKLQIDHARGENKVLRFNITEASKAQEHFRDKSYEVDRMVQKVHHKQSTIHLFQSCFLPSSMVACTLLRE